MFKVFKNLVISRKLEHGEGTTGGVGDNPRKSCSGSQTEVFKNLLLEPFLEQPGGIFPYGLAECAGRGGNHLEGGQNISGSVNPKREQKLAGN